MVLFYGLFLSACRKDTISVNSSTIDANGGANELQSTNAPFLFTSGNKTLHLVNGITGGIAFEYTKLLGHPALSISGAPGIINDSIAIIPASNKMFCISYRDNAVIWETRFDETGEPGRGYKTSEICINAGTVFMAYADYQSPYGNTRHASKFFAVDIATGNISWVIDLLQLGIDYDYFSNPTCTEETVFLPVRNKLFAFDTKTGTIKWTFITDTYANLSNPAYADDKIFVASNATGANSKDSVFALGLNSGLILWRKEVLGLSVNPTPVIYKDRLYININSDMVPLVGGVLCMDASDGKDIWQYTRPYQFPTAPGICPVFISDDMLFMSEIGHTNVYRLNIITGEKVWSFPATTIYSTNQDEGPVASGGLVYFRTTFSDMYALNAADGSQVWKTHINAGQVTNINTGPVLKDPSGTLLYSSESGMQQ